MSTYHGARSGFLLWCLISVCMLSGRHAYHHFNPVCGQSSLFMRFSISRDDCMDEKGSKRGAEGQIDAMVEPLIQRVQPITSNERAQQSRTQLLRSALAVGFGGAFGSARKVDAIGSIFELKDQKMVLQDICLNVPDTKSEALLLSDTLQQTINVISDKFVKGESTTVLAFGPTAYISPDSFRPGISSFFTDGAHATLTLRDRVSLDKTMESGEEVVEIFEPGNGLRFIKFGTEALRISKAIAAGSEIKYAYGWVDLVTPGGVPYQFVVGTARDPLMTACLATSDMKKSLNFFTESLGMQVLPFKYSRTVGSNFEAQPKKGEVCLGYGNSTLSLMLTPVKGPVEVGSILDSFNIVVDDSDIAQIPDEVRRALEAKEIVFSPDGYPFRFMSYTEFQKSSQYLKEITSTSFEQMKTQQRKEINDG